MTTGAIIEIIDSHAGKAGNVLVPDRVLVNGTDIGWVAEGGLTIDLDTGTVATATMTLIPSEVIIRGPKRTDPPDEVRTTTVQWAVALVVVIQAMSLLAIAAIA